MANIEGKWALVTGASRGVGLRVANALAREGCQVILHSRRLKHSRDVIGQLRSGGFVAHAAEAELDTSAGVSKLIEEVGAITDDHLDILYNNAAVMTTYRTVFEPTFEEYSTSFMVNSIAPAKLCDAFLPAMIERDWGRIVNVTSGIANEPELMAYSCSKAALDRYVRDMVPTLEGTNVLMNLLDPGWLRTDMGGPKADHDPDTVIPGALVPVLLEKSAGSGVLYCAQDYN